MEGVCLEDADYGMDYTWLDKVVDSKNEADCHAKAEVEYKRCHNTDEGPVQATYTTKDGKSSRFVYPNN